MTVTVTSSSTAYDGNGVTLDFNTIFFFWEDSDLKVYLRDTTVDPVTVTLQVNPTDYAVAVGHVSGEAGQITFVTEPPSGTEVQIIRESKRTQDIDFTPTTKFPSQSAEEGLDRLQLQMQESFNALQERAITIPVTEQDPDTGYPNMELPDLAARTVTGAYLAFNSAGEPVIATAAVPVASTSAFGDTWILLADRAAGRAELRVPENRGGTVSVFQAANLSARSIPSVHGNGFFYALDTEQLSFSNGSAWVDCTIGHYTNALLPAAAAAGVVLLDTDNSELLRDDSSNLIPLQSPWGRGFIGGCTISRASATGITVALGDARAHLGNASRLGRNLGLPAGITKTLSTANTWVEGDNQPGMAKGAAQAVRIWYYVFLIAKADGTVDAAIDTSITGANILSAGSNAIETATFDQHIRRVGRFYTNSTGAGEIASFFQEGDRFTWVELFTDIGLAYTNTAQDFRTATLLTLTNCDLNTNMFLRYTTLSLTGTNGFLLSETRQVDQSPTLTVRPLTQHSAADGVSEITIFVDGSRQIRARTNAEVSMDLHIQPLGFIDRREQDA